MGEFYYLYKGSYYIGSKPKGTRVSKIRKDRHGRTVYELKKESYIVDIVLTIILLLLVYILGITEKDTYKVYIPEVISMQEQVLQLNFKSDDYNTERIDITLTYNNEVIYEVSELSPGDEIGSIIYNGKTLDKGSYLCKIKVSLSEGKGASDFDVLLVVI